MSQVRRELRILSERGELTVPVHIHLPVEDVGDWRCDYEIGWPERTRKGHAFGIDAVQAVLLATQKIGAELYTSDAHRSGQLFWLERGSGYGFPLPPGMRDLYQGDDTSL